MLLCLSNRIKILKSDPYMSSFHIYVQITIYCTQPGVAFGNVKTHKKGNPLRLITCTSCCGTAIERLSAFTESQAVSAKVTIIRQGYHRSH